jgi:hypothetical protein
MRIFLLLIAIFFGFSIVIEAQTIIIKTDTKYLPLVEGGDTIGFYLGTKSNPFKSIKLFRCSQSKKFIESNPNMDYKWVNSQLSREVYSLWNIQPIYNIGLENEIRHDNGKFFQGEKEITFHNFYEIILLSEKTYRYRKSDIAFLSRYSGSGLKLRSFLVGTYLAWIETAFFVEAFDNYADETYFTVFSALTAINGILTYNVNKKRSSNGKFFFFEKRKITEIIRRYNES